MISPSRTHRRRTHRRRTARYAKAAALAVSLLLPAAAFATEYDPDRDLSTQAMFEIVRLGVDGGPDPATVRADLDYVRGMREHHAGALSMSEEYLADPEARNPALRRLARSIIPNQAFEIALLDEVERRVERPPVPLGIGGLALRPAATGRMEQRLRFMKTPRPFVWALWGDPGPITERDVLFAKAMIIHHEGALDMARAYNADPLGRNTFLELLNIDIVTDQAQEIALMQAVIDRYPGDAAAIVVDPSMVHGMDMSGHGGGHRHHGGHGTHGGKEGAHDDHGAHAVHPSGAPAHQGAGHGAGPGKH